MKPLLIILSLITIISISSCTKKIGCTDQNAKNFDVNAEESCTNCCVYIDTISSEVPNLENDSLLYKARWQLLTSKEKWYWRKSTLLTYQCGTDLLTDSSTNEISNENSYTQYNTNFTGLFQNGSITSPYHYCGLKGTGDTLMISYAQTPMDTIVYAINTLNDSLFSITAYSKWCAQENSYYFQTEVLAKKFE